MHDIYCKYIITRLIIFCKNVKVFYFLHHKIIRSIPEEIHNFHLAIRRLTVSMTKMHLTELRASNYSHRTFEDAKYGKCEAGKMQRVRSASRSIFPLN